MYKNKFAGLIILLIGLFVSYQGQAQTLQMAALEDTKLINEYQLIGQVGEQILIYKKSNTKTEIQAFDDSLDILWTKPIELQTNRSTRLLAIIPQARTFQLLYSYYQKGNTEIHVQTFSAAAEFVSDTLVYQFKSFFDDSQVVFSKNQRYFVWYKRMGGQQQVFCYDLQTNQIIWEQLLPKTEPKSFKYMDKMTVNNEGTAYLLEQHMQRNTLGDNLPNFSLYTLYSNTDLPTQRLGFGYRYYDFVLQYDEWNGRLVIAGFYGEGKYSSKFNQVDGLFSFRQGLDAQIVYAPIATFDDPNTKKDKKMLIENFEATDILLRRDGGILLLAEQRYIYNSNAAFDESIGSGRSKDYIYKSILAASIAPNGVSEWQKILHKEQISSDDNGRYSSYFLFRGRSEIRVVFNDNVHWESGILEYLITGKGDMNRNVISHHKKKHKAIIELRHSLQISATTFLTLSRATGYGNTELYLSRMTYE